MARKEKAEEKVLPNDTMFYKCPGEHEIHGGKFDFKIIDANDESAVEAALAEGWHFTTTEAREAFDAEQVANAQHAAQLEGQATKPAATGKKAAAPASAPTVGTADGSAPAAAWGGTAPASGKQ